MTHRLTFARASKVTALLASGAFLVSGSVLFGEPRPRERQGAGAYTLNTTDTPPPEGLHASIAEHVRGQALTVVEPDGELLMELWFAREIPGATAPSAHPAVKYPRLPEGVVLAVMRLHHEHRDFRDQAVPPGTYVVRYLRQPDDGDHLGETTFRDFAVLTTVAAAQSPDPQHFEVTLGQALQLNTHPLVWGLWPGSYVVTPELPGIASHEADKWAVKVQIPRSDDDPLVLAMVVVGNERIYD